MSVRAGGRPAVHGGGLSCGWPCWCQQCRLILRKKTSDYSCDTPLPSIHRRVSLRKKRKTRTMPTACRFIQKSHFIQKI